MCRMAISWSVFPKAVSTPGIQTTKGEPLSLMTANGCPQSSMQSRSQVKMGASCAEL